MRKALSFGVTLALGMLIGLSAMPAWAHEGHDHDKPPPLNLPVAPRVIAVTPELELIGVVSSRESLTIFLHTFATNEPVAGARLTVSAERDSAEAKAEGAGVFTVSAPWLSTVGATDLIFGLTLADGSEDLLTGRLEIPASIEPGTSAGTSQADEWISRLAMDHRTLWMIGGAFAAGIMVTLLVSASGRRREKSSNGTPGTTGQPAETGVKGVSKAVAPLRRSAGLVVVGAVSLALALGPPFLTGTAHANEAQSQIAAPPSVPSTMATDQPQRMPDATLFIPKATQHLLSIRTAIVTQSKVERTMELTGRVVVGPKNLGRVQSSQPGRFIAADDKVGFVGMRVEAGELLGFVETYIEAADRATIVSQIAEAEALIAKNKTILARYAERPGSVPQIRIDEAKGELQALIKRREQLLPSTTARVALTAPIAGIISTSNVVVGQVVESRDVLFEIIDPSEFWIEASAPHTDDIAHIESAIATVHDHHILELEFLGQGLALRNHSSVLNFRVLKSDDGLAVGMTARVIMKLDQKVEGFVLPASAIVRGPAGLPIVWLKISPERFEPQVVKVEPFDGDNVVVTAGLKSDQRIVTEGVTLLNQVR